MGHESPEKFCEDLCDVVYLPRTEGISTTMLRQSIASPTGPKVIAANWG